MTPFLYILTFREFLLSSRVASVHMWQMNRRWNFIVKWHCWLDRQHYNGCYSPLSCPATWMYCSCQKCIFTVSWLSILCYPMSMQFIVLGDRENLLLKYNVHFQDWTPVARCGGCTWPSQFAPHLCPVCVLARDPGRSGHFHGLLEQSCSADRAQLLFNYESQIYSYQTLMTTKLCFDHKPSKY